MVIDEEEQLPTERGKSKSPRLKPVKFREEAQEGLTLRSLSPKENEIKAPFIKAMHIPKKRTLYNL
jgi:hypothetical protein